ncbi:MAG: FKBP-type peptidyl-prolyl cis-trans isomerase [Gammaproteobacteria bacterium]|jgi:FKBP-type peptidyl-prolyl cis-trans isomerase FklB|nr:FKBP-type peptidyl-prolyl cis-trans isomerase [Gammaproteobacteria bacterium]MBT7226965.1 FKBP-type peptidyl-prolyl cis-trans isomerase [Gammaproteobacteria bacterium]
MNISTGKSRILIGLLSIVLSAQVFAQGNSNLESDDDKIAYSIGVNIGQNLQAQGILDGIEVDTFVAGMLDAVAGNVQMSDEDMFAAIQLFQQQMAEQQQAALAASTAASVDFLSANSAKEGVVTLESGLQYMVLESGPDGSASPTVSDSVLAHYHGTLIDGTVFDSSVDRGEPAQFGLSQVISGWTEGLQLMSVGDKWRLFIPAAMAYGEASPTPAIPPNSALIFDVELLEIR